MLLSISSLGVAVRPTRSVEVVEDSPVLLVDRAMCLVDDDQVEVPGAEPTLAFAFVDQAHHGRIGRHEDAPLLVFSVTRFTGDDREVGLERIDRLVDQRNTVGQEQHPLRPVAAHQQVDKRDHGAGLSGAGRHDQQRLALAVVLEGLGDAADRRRLVVAFDDRPSISSAASDLRRVRRWIISSSSSSVRKPWMRAGRISRVVPQPMVIAVGIEDHGRWPNCSSRQSA